MYCRKCGTELKEGALFCSQCAEPVIAPQPQQPAWQPQRPVAPTDTGSWGWFVLGLFIPLVGLILFLIWKDEKPLSAKRAGIGALVGFVGGILLVILELVLFFFLGVMETFDTAYYDYEFYTRILPFFFK